MVSNIKLDHQCIGIITIVGAYLDRADVDEKELHFDVGGLRSIPKCHQGCIKATGNTIHSSGRSSKAGFETHDGDESR